MAPRSLSYGSIDVKPDDTNEFAPLVSGTSGSDPVDQKKKYYCLIAALTVVALGVTSVGYCAIAPKRVAPKQHRSFAVNKRSPAGDSLLLSKQSPVDMGFLSIVREDDASPSVIWGNRTGPLPTNSWYMNLVSHKAALQPDEASRAYTVPYIIDVAPPDNMAGIRVHWPVLSASDRNIQMVDDFKNGLCLGSKEIAKPYQVNPNEALSPLGVSLLWNESKKSTETKSMVTYLVRGMPYATMQYFGGALPTIFSYNGPAVSDSAILADGDKTMLCGTMDSKGTAVGKGKTMSVEKEIDLHFINSDFTWGVFFSSPVELRCDVTEGDEKTREFQLSVVSYEEADEPLTVRVSLLDQCTTGISNIQEHCHEKETEKKDMKEYVGVLRNGASVFPTNAQIHFSYPKENSYERVANMTIDWGAKALGSSPDKEQLLMFAMPHHQDQLSPGSDVKVTKYCVTTFHGSTCLVRGRAWTLAEDLGTPMSFNARRPPTAEAIPALATAMADDIRYRFSDNMLRAASDTYFPGKILARLARVILIASEMNALASGDIDSLSYDAISEESLLSTSHAAASESLPSEEDIAGAVDELRRGVQIWLNKNAEAPFVFDKSWGGLVNCGCRYTSNDEHGYCNNTFPDCPALADVNEDFGNGYYNDHHYHYGYHIYAAAVVAKFNPDWGEEYFEKVLLYIRDFANPSAADEFFVPFRQKDWFLGSSWASGIVSAENSPHGRNEESSSEAIAAYEGIALYGAVMADVFSKSGSNDENFERAKLVRDAGQLLTVSELRATNRYWHIWSSDDHKNAYPAAYQQPVVGMLYDTMASFQTWFAPWAVVSYGIQLMPFTPVAEQRDDPVWAAELYPLYDTACQTAGDFCYDNGWSILQAGLLAEAGGKEEAMEQLMAIPSKVFDTLGGMGNSLSNTIWFISTRPTVDFPTVAKNSTGDM